MANRIESGTKFWKLTVKKRVEPLRKKDGRSQGISYLCECECGEQKVILGQSLLKGLTKSCGCLRKEAPPNKLDLTDRRFDKLLAVNYSHFENDGAYWLCKCDCGNETFVLVSNLTRGNTRSCGCNANYTKYAQKARTKKEELRIENIMVPSLYRKPDYNSKTGVKGVTVVKRANGLKYKVTIGINNKRIYGGLYDNLGDAIEARKKLEDLHHKPHIERFEERKEDLDNH